VVGQHVAQLAERAGGPRTQRARRRLGLPAGRCPGPCAHGADPCDRGADQREQQHRPDGADGEGPCEERPPELGLQRRMLLPERRRRAV